MQNWLKVFGTGVVCALLSSTVALAEVKVSAVDAGWNVNAQDEPLSDVLKAMGKTIGIKISGTTKLVNDPSITGIYEGDLETVFRRLLRNSDYAFETVADENGAKRITRLILLSGVKGKAPSRRAINAARKLPAPRKVPKPLSEAEKKQGERVTSLLAKRAQLTAGIESEAPQPPTAKDDPDKVNATSSGITRNADGSFDITPEAQARMAEATRRARQDLEALVTAIRRNDNNSGDNN
jgi:hypothetical protein